MRVTKSSLDVFLTVLHAGIGTGIISDHVAKEVCGITAG
jgi:hypothetical protein